jgi:HSP20 family molecular chaperone IbpA
MSYKTVDVFDELTKYFGDPGSDLMFGGIPSQKRQLSGNDSYRFTKTDESYTLEIPAIGLSKSDITVKVIESKLCVESKSSNYWRTAFDLKFALPSNSDIENTTASVTNGLLTIIIPINKKLEREVQIS